MNFRDLEYIIATARYLSFSKAAAHCHVSQPSLSIQIKKVETALSADIFNRSQGKIRLTPFGESFVEKGKQILALREEISTLAYSTHNPLEGQLHIGAILTIAPYMFPQMLKGMQDKAPKIELTLHEGKSAHLAKNLLKGELDAALVSLPTDQHIFDSALLFQEPFLLAAPQGHAVTQHAVITKDHLESLPLMLLEEGHCFREQALDVCRQNATYESQNFRATSLETIRHFVSMGEGITLMPRMACTPNDSMAYLPLADTHYGRDVGIIWPKHSPKKAQIEKFVSLMQDIFTSA